MPPEIKKPDGGFYMTLIPIINEFEELGRQIPGVIRLLEMGSLDFEKQCGELLNDYVELAEKRNMRFAADLAIIKGKALTYKETGMLTGENRKQKKSDRQSHALNCLNEAYKLTSAYFEKDNTCLIECDNTCRQIMTVAAVKGILTDGGLEAAWVALKADPELSAALNHIIGMAGPHNARILIDKNLFLVNEL